MASSVPNWPVILLDSWHRAGMHKQQSRQESDRALLERVKKEMDEPRMAESTREEYEVNHNTLHELEKPS